MMERLAFTAVVLLAACQRPEAAQNAPRSTSTPRIENLILVTIDTLRADVLGYQGGRARTPVLDSLAGRGWRFDRCFSASMLTNPSHASIMTSLYPRDHGVYDNESGLADGAPTLAGAARRAGFATAAVINFPHLNPEVANLGGFERVVRASREERRAAEVVRLGLEVIDGLAPEKRFFLWLHITDPHAPYEPPEDHAVQPVAGEQRTPLVLAARAAPRFQRHNPWFQQVLRRYRSVEEVVARYLAEVEVADAGVGLLLAGLANRGLTERTALVITSDHGENLGEHDLFFHHGGLYEESVHVPLLVVVPGSAPAQVAAQVETVDIAPTVLELLGIPRWQPMRGGSLRPIVQGDRGREYVFSEHMLAQQVAVRGARGTLILHRKSTRQFPSYDFVAGKREVYDRNQDPREEADLGEGGPLAHLLGTALQEYMERGLQLAARPASDQDRESLRALGYIE